MSKGRCELKFGNLRSTPSSGTSYDVQVVVIAIKWLFKETSSQTRKRGDRSLILIPRMLF